MINTQYKKKTHVLKLDTNNKSNIFWTAYKAKKGMKNRFFLQ